MRRLCVLSAVVLAVQGAQAQSTFTWDGETSGNWGTAANWDATPTFAASNNFVFYALPEGNLNTFLGVARTIGGLTFNNNVDNDITIRTYSNDTGTGGNARNLNFDNGLNDVFITVASGATGNITIAPGGGRPRIASNLVIDHNGSGNLEIGNFIQKTDTNTSMSVTKNGTGTLTLSNTDSPNTPYDDLIINAGEVRLAGSTATGTGSIIMTAGTLSTIGSGNFTLNNSYNFSGSLTFGNATDSGRITFSTNSSGTLAGNTTLHTVANLILNQAIGETGGNYSLTKTGAGTLTLGGVNTYTGATTVGAGSLIIGATGSVGGSSLLDVAGGATLNVSAVTGGFVVGGNQTLKGSGTVVGNTTINGIHSPGNSPGIQTFADGLTYATGSTFVWELFDNTTTGRGTVFDGVDVTGGALTINTGVTTSLVFDGTGSNVLWSDEFWSNNQSWLVFDNANAPSILGIPSIIVGLDSAGDGLTDRRANASFSWGVQGNDIYLNYDAVPEPSTYALLALAAAGLGAHVMRRRRR